MAKDKEVAVVNLASGAVSTIEKDGKVLNVAELLAQMQKADTGQELTSEYFKLEPGEEARVIITEMTSMKGMGDNKDELIDAVRLIGEDGFQKISADKILVSTAKNLDLKKQLPKAVLITCVGMIKGQNGNYRDLKIKDLLM